MKRRADKPVHLHGTLIGHLCFTKFGICPILINGLTLSNGFRDEDSAEAALLELVEKNEAGEFLGFSSEATA